MEIQCPSCDALIPFVVVVSIGEIFSGSSQRKSRIGGIVLMSNVAFYMMFVYITTFLSDQVGVPMAEALEIDTVSMIILLLVILAAGWLSDRVGRKPVLLAASIGCNMFAIPLFMAIEHPDSSILRDGYGGDHDCCFVVPA